MRSNTLLVISGLAAALVVLTVPEMRPGVTADRAEVTRLRAHFDSVDGELRRAALVGPDAARGASRARLISWLKDYRNAGEFPVNDQFPDRATPFFRDSRGVLCAMAYLVARSGRGDIVDRIARTRNNAFIPALASDPELVQWLDSVGLTVAEAARIQPAYSGQPGYGISTGYAITSVVLSGSTLVASGFNVFAPSKTSGWFGIATGLGAGIVGLTKLDQTDEDTLTLAAANLFVGVVGLALGVRGVIVGSREPPSGPPGTSSVEPRLELGILPSISSEGNGPQFGLMVRARF